MNTVGRMWLVAFIIIYSGVTKAKAQDSVSQSYTVNKKQSITDLVALRSYVFEIQTVLPLSSNPGTVNPDYTLSVTPDKIISRLPYYGRAYVAPLNANDAGIEFSSDSFTYNETKNRKGWQILIKPGKQKVQQMTLNISENGYANLTVISSDRQQISYRGIVKKHTERSVPPL